MLENTTTCEYQSQLNVNQETIGLKFIDIAWAAGLFEGEGCIGKDKISRYAAMEMTDKDVMEDFVKIVGYGKLRGPYKRGEFKPTYRWKVTKRLELKRILELFLPFLKARRTSKANEALRHHENIS